jgi:phosphotransacetylase/acyl dehydratase
MFANIDVRQLRGVAMTPDAPDDAYIENRIFESLVIGETASLTHTVTQRDIELFAAVSGDVNPAHMDPAYAATDMFHKIIIHGMWGAGLISAVIGTKLPGPGTIYLGQELQFRRPVGIGDTITATLTLREKQPDKGNVLLDCLCANQNGEAVIIGTAEARAPTEKVRLLRIAPPDVRLRRHDGMRAIFERAAAGSPIATAVVHPCEASVLQTVLAAVKAGLIVPILVGPEAKIRNAAATAGVDISGFRLVDVPHSHAAAIKAVALVRASDAALLMKGALHTDELMSPVVAHETGLRTERQISHVYLMDVPDYPRPLLITDAAINIAPTLEEKRDIVQNAIDFAHVVGIKEPRVALLSAVETVTSKMHSTLDAASLCKMADRGQIIGGLVDGPLAFDNAINEKAAADKGIVSKVAGRADILLVPDLEAGNMLAKQLTFLAGGEAAGVILGARVPIVLASRADGPRTQLASCALGVLLARAARLAGAPAPTAN